MGAESFRIVSEEINIEKMVESFVRALNSLRSDIMSGIYSTGEYLEKNPAWHAGGFSLEGGADFENDSEAWICVPPRYVRWDAARAKF